MGRTSIAAVAIFAATSTMTVQAGERVLLWGDTHVHTSSSPDAYLMQNRSATPDDAYRFAKGEPIIHPYNRARIQIGTPLDFLVVSDHAEYLGVIPLIIQGDPLVTATETGRRYYQMAAEGRELDVFSEIIGAVNTGEANPDLANEQISRTMWKSNVDAAERHNDPGRFTTFIGWEWSSTPGGANLHRVVFMADGAETAEKFLPYSSLDSNEPEDLWRWLATTSEETGANLVSIPHNMNISKGKMFDRTDSPGRPIDADYGKLRMAWEPVMEMTQIKGDSETDPGLSPEDEFAGFEPYKRVIGVGEHKGQAAGEAGSFARSALRRGLEFEETTGVNPYKLGMIGATDSHTGASTAEEDNFWGKMALDSTPETGAEETLPGVIGFDYSASGLAAVWAEENTRASIMEAVKRREVYATTGPRLVVRFFGGWDFGEDDSASPDLAERGYQKGVPMGSDLSSAPDGRAPAFLIHAARDPVGANLDRVQIIKGWLGEDGATQEQVFDVVWSGERAPGEDGKLPAVGNTVNLRTGKTENSIGAAKLAAVWTDPDFDAEQRAFYYVRVLQIPTIRHSALDAIALHIDPAEIEAKTGRPATIQERAYSSPIWYTP